MDINLVERLINGDETAFREVFYRYYPNLKRFANSYLHDSYAAENMVQDAFVVLWEKRGLLDIQSNIKAFLVTIIKNKSINYIEKLRNRHRIENSSALSVMETNLDLYSLHALNPDEFAAHEITSIVENTINALPDQTRDIFRLSRYQGLTNREIAMKMNLSEKSIEYHISKSLKTLRSKLSDYLHIIIFF